MLKRTIGFLLSLALIQSVAYVMPTYASSAEIVITHIQTGITGGATQELIGLYNNGADEVDVTDWCLRNKNDVAFACFTPSNSAETFVLPAHKSALIVSQAFAERTTLEIAPSLIYVSMNQTSGSLVGTNDRVVIVDAQGNEIERFSWTASIASGMLFHRMISMEYPTIYFDTDIPEEWEVISVQQFPTNEVERRQGVIDLCLNIEGEQIEIPLGLTGNEQGDCVSPPAVTPPHIIITELLPNAAGSDQNNEFIELYNADDIPISLAGFRVWVGNNATSFFELPEDMVIPSGEYKIISNAIFPFTLSNTSGKVKLTQKNGTLLSETDMYYAPKESQSWAFIDGSWQYSTQPTPGLPNILGADLLITTSQSASTLKPCAANQYRHPETNRCRLIESSTTERVPCKDTQYRSEETGRCRNITSTTSPTPCKEGQERSPETNRCRTVKNMSKADYKVLGVTPSNEVDQWYILAAIGAVVILLAGYAAWEWGDVLKRVFSRAIRFVRQQK